MFRSILEEVSSLDPVERDYVTLNIDYVTDEAFLLSFVEVIGKEKYNRDFILTKNLREITKKFPSKNNRGNKPSILQGPGCIRILREIYSRIIGTYLKPMDTDCLESGYF